VFRGLFLSRQSDTGAPTAYGMPSTGLVSCLVWGRGARLLPSWTRNWPGDGQRQSATPGQANPQPIACAVKPSTPSAEEAGGMPTFRCSPELFSPDKPCAGRARTLSRGGFPSRAAQQQETGSTALDETGFGTYKRASVGPAVSSRAQTRFARRPEIAPSGAISGHHPDRKLLGQFVLRTLRTSSSEFELVFEMVRDAGAAH